MEQARNVQVLIRHTCPACHGSGTQVNPDHIPGEQFTPEKFDICVKCEGKKTVDQWVPLESFLTILTSLDIPVI